MTRKTITVVFCDLAGSSELFERLDPEALRGLNERYYAVAQAAVHRHGGTIEKYIGDAVVAVLGILVAHEDDAVRAVRAAVEIRDGVGKLGLAPRIGIETGEVVAGDPAPGHGFATGPALVVAERLERQAGAHGILVGAATFQLVRDAVTTEPAGELELKGIAHPVQAWRIHDVEELAPGLARRLDTPLVGRERELERLRAELEAAVEEQACRLVTVVGPAGAGKSRLVLELVAGHGSARAVTARCLRYGESATFRPVAEILRDEQFERLDELIDDARAIDVLRALKDGDSSATVDEIARALRSLLEALANVHPLVVVFEDVESAEPGLLDVIEYVLRTSRSRAILVVCVARPEVLEARPAWAGGAVVALEPLSDSDGLRLLRALAGAEVDPGAARRIVQVARGNPLFAEELLRMLVDEGALRRSGDRWVPTRLLDEIARPGSVQAVLEARLDRLDPDERLVVQSAAVIGPEISRRAIAALLSGAPETVEPRLERLAPTQLIVPVPGDEDRLSFGHPLIREVAYASLPKAERAKLHERFARWSERSGEEIDADGTIGHHLYTAIQARRDLDPADDHAAELAAEAVPRLEAAAGRAAARQDSAGAAGLFSRTVELLPAADPHRLELLIPLGEALRTSGRLGEAERCLREAEERAAAAGMTVVAKSAALDRALVGWYTNPLAGVHAVVQAAEELIPIAQERCDDGLLAHAWSRLGLAQLALCQIAAMQDALEHARQAAESAAEHTRSSIRRQLALAALLGPAPREVAMQLCHELLAEAKAEDDRQSAVGIANYIATLDAYAGRFESARARLAGTLPAIEESGNRLALEVQKWRAGRVELLASAPAAAESLFREGIALLETLGDKGGNLASYLVFLGEALHEQMRDAEAEETLTLAAEVANTADVEVRVVGRSTLARIRARAGRIDEAEALAREAVAIADGTDAPIMRADALRALAVVLSEAASVAESEDAARDAIALYEAKGSTVGAAATRRLLERDAVRVL